MHEVGDENLEQRHRRRGTLSRRQALQLLAAAGGGGGNGSIRMDPRPTLIRRQLVWRSRSPVPLPNPEKSPVFPSLCSTTELKNLCRKSLNYEPDRSQ